MQNQWSVFKKMTKIPTNFDLFWGPKWADNANSETHILHTFKSVPGSLWNHIDVKPVENFEKMTKIRNFSYMGVPKIFYAAPKVAATSL